MPDVIPLPMFLAQMESASRINLFELFAQSGPMAWFVAGVLIALSLASWAIMIARYLQCRRAGAQTTSFLEVFRKSQRFSEVASQADRLQASPLVGLFRAGYIEMRRRLQSECGEEDQGLRLGCFQAFFTALVRGRDGAGSSRFVGPFAGYREHRT